MTKLRYEAAAAARLAAGLGGRKRGELLEMLRPVFSRTEPWIQAAKYVGAVMSDLPKRNGWTIARYVGDRTPDRTQRLLNRAAWDGFAAMAVVRGFAVAGLDQAAGPSAPSRAPSATRPSPATGTPSTPSAAGAASAGYLDSAANHGLTALDAIASALAGKPWLPATQPAIPAAREVKLRPGPADSWPAATLPASPLAA